MNRLPDPLGRQPQATQAGQPNPEALALIADVEDALAQAQHPDQPAATAYRNDTLPAAYTIGPTPPHPQPGRPPMSQRATDTSTLILSVGVASVPVGGMASLFVYALGSVDPTTLAIAATTPAALALPILALARLARRAKEVVEATPPVIHQHYTGAIQQTTNTVNSKTNGLWASTRNQLPAGD